MDRADSKSRILTLRLILRCLGDFCLEYKDNPKIKHLTECFHFSQTLTDANRTCSFTTRYQQITVALNKQALKSYLQHLNWPGPATHIGFGLLDTLWVCGSCYEKRILISPINIWWSRQKTNDRTTDNLHRAISWVLAHELKHHHQRLNNSFWFKNYLDPRTFYRDILCWCLLILLLASLGFLFAELSVSLYLISIVGITGFCLSLIEFGSTLICEYQADRFAFEEMEKHSDLLRKCFVINSQSRMSLLNQVSILKKEMAASV